MTHDILITEEKEQVAIITLNRPEKRNSLSPDLLIKLHQKLEALGREATVRAVIIRGVGEKAFSSGYDIAAIPTEVSPEVGEKLKTQNPLELALQSVIKFPYLTIAMLNGYAYGAGCELAVSCDLRVGREGIRMGMPPTKLGLVYPVSGLMRFVNLIGVARSKEVFLTARYFDAERAKEMGLLDYLVPPEELESFTWKIATESAANAPLAVRGTKRIINMLARTPDLTEEQRQEADRIVADAFNSEDLKEGQTAFLEKRKPVFKGR